MKEPGKANDSGVLNAHILRKGILAAGVNRVISLTGILKALMGFTPGFTGQRRLACRISYYLSKEDTVTVKPSGIYCGEKLLESLGFDVMDFIPNRGVEFSKEDSGDVENILKEVLFKKDAAISKKYYRLQGLAAAVLLGCFFSLLYLTLRLILMDDMKYTTSERIADSIWLIPSFYFFTQTILFYKSRSKHMSVTYSFTEAGEEEEKQLKCDKNQPHVISVVPTYMEESDMVKRTLYSLCLQNYRNMRVVLLLGNDFLSTDEKVQENTRQMRDMVAGIKRELRAQKLNIQHVLKEQGLKGTSVKGKRISPGEFKDKNQLRDIFLGLHKLYENAAQWFMAMGDGISKEETKYPIDEFLIEHTFTSQHAYYMKQAEECRMLAQGMAGEEGLTEEVLLEAKSRVQEFYGELQDMFSIKLEVFMRTKYENLAQEKTKAGNLTAYSSLIGGTWKAEKQSSGRWRMIPSNTGKTIDEPKYFAVFDSDTVVKPNYTLRKVAFLQRKENSEIGLIQSPYVVPTPEPTTTASASGIHSFWFVPVSVGLSAFKSAFWLGFNGVLRFEAVKKIQTFITDTIIEDTQNSIKMKAEGYGIVTSPEENCMTFSPQELKAVKVQRTRWASGGFEIAKDLIISMWRGKSGINGFWQRILAIHYVLGLNFLPIAMTSFYFMESPFKYQYYFVETIPFFLYIVSYIALLKTYTKYKFKDMADGLAMGVFMNLYHLSGTFHSLKRLSAKYKSRFFKSTPKNKDGRIWIGNMEFFGMAFIIIWFWLRLVNQLSQKVYYDVFPLYQITLALYGIERFHGWGRIGTDILKVKKLALIKNTLIGTRDALIKMQEFKFSKQMRTCLAVVGVIILCSSSISMAFQWKNRDNLKKEVENYLYEEKIDSRTPLNPYEQNKKLGRGINIASALEAPQEGEWGITLKEEYFKIIKEAGFDTIRLPVKFSAHAMKRIPYTIDRGFFERMDWVLVQAQKHGLNIVLDLHNYDELYFDKPEKHYKRFISIWKQIASRYRDCDAGVYYELINEPHDNLSPEKWCYLLAETIKEIRKVDTYHTIIIDAAEWGGAYGLIGLEIPFEEKNVIVTFHTYTPQFFTHQGAEFAPDDYKYSKGVVWPGPPKEFLELPKQLRKSETAKEWYKNYNTMPYEDNPAGPRPIQEELNLAQNWGKSNDRPIWLGEFGANNYGDEQSQINWTRFVVEEAEKRGMTWAYWDFADTCKAYDLKTGKWKEGLLKALMGKS